MTIRFTITALLSFFYLSCAGMQQPKDDLPPAVPKYDETIEPSVQNGYWLAHPDSGDLVIWGVANRQRKRGDEIKFALDDAAYKVALFYGVKGKVYTVASNGTGFWDYSMNIDYELDYDTEYKKYLEILNYDVNHDILSIDGALLLRVHYKLQSPLNMQYNSELKDGKPEWIRKPPDKISGYIAGIGYAGPHSKFKDTISKAYENSIVSIIKKLSVESSNKISTSDDGSTFMSEVQRSEGELKEFFVLEMWHDHNTDGVWILAIAKQK